MWTELETSTYQDHVIKHVLGATVLGWVVIGDAAHFLLDVGLLWTIYFNAEMNLMAQAVAIQDLESNDVTRDDVTALATDADLLNSQGFEATGLTRFTVSPVECAIRSVELFGAEWQYRILITGETAAIEIQTFSEPPHFSINAIGGLRAS
jgi:hypothetical protein